MKTSSLRRSRRLLTTATLLAIFPVHAGTVIFSDNFNVPDNTTDGSQQGPDRYAGLFGGNTVSRAALSQSNIAGQQLIPGWDGALRFVDSTDLTLRRNFAEGAAGEAIRAAGGFRIEFDRTQNATDNMNWVGVGVGSVFSGDAWIADSRLDFGFLLRNNGNAQRFDNGVSADINSSYTPSTDTRHYTFDFQLDPVSPNPFEDGSFVTATATVDGVPVILGTAGETNYTFQWDGNGGVIQVQLLFSIPGGSVDNLSISTLDLTTGPSIPPGPIILIVEPGKLVTASFDVTPGASYSLQRSTTMEDGSWLQVGDTVQASDTGEVSIQDPTPPEGRAFYRIAYRP